MHSFNRRKIHSPAFLLTRVLLNVAYLCASSIASALCYVVKRSTSSGYWFVDVFTRSLSLQSKEPCKVFYDARFLATALLQDTSLSTTSEIKFQIKIEGCRCWRCSKQILPVWIRGDITRTPVLFEIHRWNYMLIRTCKFRWRWNYATLRMVPEGVRCAGHMTIRVIDVQWWKFEFYPAENNISWLFEI